MGKHDGDGGGTEERGPGARAASMGTLGWRWIRRSARILGYTWLALLPAIFVIESIHGGRSGLAALMVVGWIGFPAGILVGLLGQLVDLAGFVTWGFQMGFTDRGYWQASRPGASRWAPLGYVAFVVAYWVLLPFELFCCFPVVC